MKNKRQNGETPAVDTTAPSDCAVPPALPKAELHKLLFRPSEQEAEEIKGM
jgi:hypothetical protein